MERAADLKHVFDYIGDPAFTYVEFDFSRTAPLPSEALANGFLRSRSADTAAVLEAAQPAPRRPVQPPPAPPPEPEAAAEPAPEPAARPVDPPGAARHPHRFAAAVSTTATIDDRRYGEPPRTAGTAPLPPWAVPAGPSAGAEPDRDEPLPEATDEAGGHADSDAPERDSRATTPLAQLFGKLGA